MPNSNLNEDDRTLAFRIAAIVETFPPDRVGLILADAQRMAIERWQGRQRRMERVRDGGR